MIQSQTYTVGSAIGQAVESLRIPDIDRYGLTQLLLIDWLHACILQWFQEALPNIEAFYRDEIGVTIVSGKIDTSSLALGDPIEKNGIPVNLALQDSTNGEIPFVSDRFYRYVLANTSLYADARLANLGTNSIAIVAGSSAPTVGTLTLLAVRPPIKATAMTDAPYVPDQYMPNVVDRLTAKIADFLSKEVPNPQQETQNELAANQVATKESAQRETEGT